MKLSYKEKMYHVNSLDQIDDNGLDVYEILLVRNQYFTKIGKIKCLKSSLEKKAIEKIEACTQKVIEASKPTFSELVREYKKQNPKMSVSGIKEYISDVHGCMDL